MSLLERPLTNHDHRVETDWRIVAPWYRWERLDGLEEEREQHADKPALHMYGSADFVSEFLADPQRSMQFDADIDTFNTSEIAEIPLTPGGLKKRLSNRTKVWPINERTMERTRKLFMPAHQRFYTIAAELHCDRPGFPKVDPAKVAEVGFVIRRRRVPIEDEQAKEAATVLRELATARAIAQHQASFAAARSRSRVLHPFRANARSRVASGTRAALRAYEDVSAAQRKVAAWADLNGLVSQTEAWVPTGNGNFGAWLPITDEPDEVIERVYPMRLLTPDPNDPEHAAHDGSIWWAHIPTASDEITSDGSARFSETGMYEIRVVARASGPCPGPPVWSAATEPIKFASFFDPDGCAQRPIEIRLPDFASLQATTAAPSVKFSTPPNSSIANLPEGQGNQAGLDAQGGEEICFFFIPLITIVAMFLLSIFLPIIVFLFNLWWMLALKFCIPPSLTLEFELEASLDIDMSNVGIDADIDFDVEIAGLPQADQDRIEDALKDLFNESGKAYQQNSPPFGTDENSFENIGDDLVDEFSFDALIRLAIAQGTGRSASGGAPMFEHDRPYTSRVQFEQVVHP